MGVRAGPDAQGVVARAGARSRVYTCACVCVCMSLLHVRSIHPFSDQHTEAMLNGTATESSADNLY